MQRKERIIKEANRLFSSRGFLATSINDIMDAAGTSKGGVYNHFSNKEELCLAVLAESRRIWRQVNLSGVKEIESPVGRIKRILENYRDRYLPDSAMVPGGCIFVQASVESAVLAEQWPRLADEIADGFGRFKNMVTRYLDQARASGEIRHDVDTAEAADMIFSSMLGASVTYGMSRSRTELNRNIESIIHYLDSNIDGLRKKSINAPGEGVQIEDL